MPAVNRIAQYDPPDACPACERSQRILAEAKAYYSQGYAEADGALRIRAAVEIRERQVTEREIEVRRRCWGAAVVFLAGAVVWVAALMARVS